MSMTTKYASKEQVHQWIQQCQQSRDEDAQTQLVLNYKSLIYSITNRYVKNYAQQEDLFQVGVIGLLKAIRRFDVSIQRSFEAFAIPTILGEIKRYIRDTTWDVHVPRRVKELGPKIKRKVAELTTTLQRSPSILEIAQALDTSLEEVLETMEMMTSYNTLSLDVPMDVDSEDRDRTFFDVVGSVDENFDYLEKMMAVQASIQVLDHQERDVIELTFMANMTQIEIGKQLGISQMHVSRIKRTALDKLKTAVMS
nr:RNA polymerase sigma factor SigB [Kurthia sp. Dielmo]